MSRIILQPQKSFWQTILDWLRGNAQTVKYGDYIHFPGKDNTTGNVEKGSVLFGWHRLEDGTEVHGIAHVTDVKDNIAQVYIKIASK